MSRTGAPLQFGRLWQETQDIVRRHADLLLPVAGLFLFVPQLLLSRQVGGRAPAALFSGPEAMLDFIVLPLVLVAGIAGQLVIYSLALNDGTAGYRLGEVIRKAFGRLLPAVAVSLVQGIAVGVGLVLLILPGLWLMARFVAALPLVATDEPDPVRAIQRSWQLTAGRGLVILGMLALLISAFLLLSIVFAGLGAALGVAGTVAAGQPATGWGVGRWLFEVITTGVTAVFGLYYSCFVSRLTLALWKPPLWKPHAG